MYPKIKFTAKNWSDLCNFYSKVIFWNFCLRKYFLLFFAEFKLLIFHNNLGENFRKIEQVELVENLPPSYLPYKFLHNLHSFLPVRTNTGSDRIGLNYRIGPYFDYYFYFFIYFFFYFFLSSCYF